MPARKSTAAYLDAARQIHGDRYDYSIVPEIRSNKQYVPIICREHGVFQQVVSCHINAAQGCPACGGNLRKAIGTVLEDAFKAHGERYVYPPFAYTSNKQMIDIICRDHGPFSQQIKAHLNGVGCPWCATNPKTDTASFIVKARKHHGERFDYSKVVYVNNERHITITCRKHGDYQQTPHSHLAGNGCSRCVSNSSNQENAWLDSLNIPGLSRQHKLKVGSRRFTVDGYDPITNTVYEFNGDYFHGNPRLYDAVWVQRLAKQSFGALHHKTQDKERTLKEAGFNIVSIWESDWMKRTNAKQYRKELKPTDRFINQLAFAREWAAADDDYNDPQLAELLTQDFRRV